MDELTPRRIVEELDRYIVGQARAKRAVAVALRNRFRRLRIQGDMRQEIAPKNIILIGKTGVGKTEIARRLANLAGAPFLKVEATKYTEVGYVGRDVESMIRDLVEVAIGQVRKTEAAKVKERADEVVTEILLDALTGHGASAAGHGEAPRETGHPAPARIVVDATGQASVEPDEHAPREELRHKLLAGALDDREVEVELKDTGSPVAGVIHGAGMEDIEIQFRNLVRGMVPERSRKRRLPVREAREALHKEQLEVLLDNERLVRTAVEAAEQAGIVFVDEIDKVAVAEGRHGPGPDVSREGVQRDLLPIVEGTTVSTKHGPVRTDHVLFIAAGAFNVAKPADLIPELQGRFPIRVELDDLGEEELRRILVEPRNALVKQYQALLATEGLTLEFTPDAIVRIARVAHEVNTRSENIGARRLYTVVEKLLEDLLFEAPEATQRVVRIDADYVQGRLGSLVEDRDLARFIL